MIKKLSYKHRRIFYHGDTKIGTYLNLLTKNYLQQLISNNDPIVATSDYVRAYSQLISSYTDNKFLALGTDGFGRSDTRKNLRDFFEVDSKHIVVSSLYTLYEDGKISLDKVEKAIKKYNLNNNKINPWDL